MYKEKINLTWTFAKGTVSMMDLFLGGAQPKKVDLPHDAMIHEERIPDTENGHQTGFYPGGQYTYIKTLKVPQVWEGQAVVLEFEGVAGISRVYVNGDFVVGNTYPYTGFSAHIEGFLSYGQSNEIKVEVNCPEQASRWYSGAGIYRDVNLLLGGAVHLPENTIKITTPEVAEDLAMVVVESELVNRTHASRKVTLRTELLDSRGNTVAIDSLPVTVFADSRIPLSQRIAIIDPLLWDDETPNLYTCRMAVQEDSVILDEEANRFGIRSLALSPQKGLCVNGRPVKLRGACVHHDNGIIGTATFSAAEFRRCEQLKAAGFNCLRSSHHPMSKAMLDACDQLGLYIIDELYDMWTRTKNPNDYASFFFASWERDLQSMVDKDYNHPSVIFYSLGNEIPEAGSARGAEWCRRMNKRTKELDATRYTVNGINGMLACTARMGEIMQQVTGMTMEEMAELQQAAPQGGGEGADELNGMMSVLQGPLADGIATSPILYDMLNEYASGTDVAGYNYLTSLHLAEKERNPNRVVLGAETFPADIVRLWDIVESNPHVIGDMTWAGYDYLGEAGCGIFHYDGAQNFASHWPDRLAGIGDIDILGNRKPISYLREIVYGLRKEPYIAVLRMNRNGQKSSITPWMWKDNIASWTWPGYEGQTASVDVYADADEAELWLNGTLLERKTVEGYVATFEVAYATGELAAVVYEAGVEKARYSLETADNEVQLAITANKEVLHADGSDLAFLSISVVDAAGRLNPFAEKEVTVSVNGAGFLQGFGSAIPSGGSNYQETTWPTYDGRLMAVLRSGTKPGEVTLEAKAEGCETQHISLRVL